MVLSIGGPPLAMLTCLATAMIAFNVGVATEAVLTRLKALLSARPRAPVH
jgi:hypothetical protein